MSWSQHGQQFVLDSLQNKARWHLAANEWDNSLSTLHTIVQMYDNENQSALTVGALMQDQGQDIVQWVQLIDYANRQLVAALETAHEQITQLAGAEHARMEHQNLLARAW